jgi:hypothetical protein
MPLSRKCGAPEPVDKVSCEFALVPVTVSCKPLGPSVICQAPWPWSETDNCAPLVSCTMAGWELLASTVVVAGGVEGNKTTGVALIRMRGSSVSNITGVSATCSFLFLSSARANPLTQKPITLPPTLMEAALREPLARRSPT